ncbi:phage baseplate protein, partial [Enterobacter hormaechei]
MATPGSLTIGGSDASRINSTQNSNNSSATRTKGDNGFTILASVYNSSSDSYIQNYQAIVFDAVTDTGIRRQADITSYPVESGAEVSDHVQIKNNTFKLSGIISETPVRLEKDLLYSAGVNGTRISQAIEYLDKMFDSRQPITLVTEHKVYENVILSGISYDYKSEYAMQFDLEFEQI